MTSTVSNPPSAGLLRRLAALLYDILLLFGLWTLTSALMLLVTGGWLAEPDRPNWLIITLQALLVLSTFGFFTWFWTHGGQTLGMRAWRLQLVGQNGAPVTVRQAVIRLVAAGLSLATAGLGLWWVLIDPEQRAWHDRLSKTRLVVVPKNR